MAHWFSSNFDCIFSKFMFIIFCCWFCDSLSLSRWSDPPPPPPPPLSLTLSQCPLKIRKEIEQTNVYDFPAVVCCWARTWAHTDVIENIRGRTSCCVCHDPNSRELFICNIISQQSAICTNNNCPCNNHTKKMASLSSYTAAFLTLVTGYFISHTHTHT